MSEPPPQDDPRTDDLLIDAANRGDAKAFEALYRRYRDWVFRLGYRFTGNHDDALDVLQDTFAYFMQQFPGFYLYARVTTFLYPAVKNTSLALLRKKRRTLPPDAPVRMEVVAGDVEPGTSRAELAKVLAALPDAQREVVLMRFVDGLDLQDIAEALRTPLGTIKSRLHNAIQTLQKDERIKGYFGR